ncbi:hypothetical protein D3C71_2166370 [compost metagenome]
MRFLTFSISLRCVSLLAPIASDSSICLNGTGKRPDSACKRGMISLGGADMPLLAAP